MNQWAFNKLYYELVPVLSEADRMDLDRDFYAGQNYDIGKEEVTSPDDIARDILFITSKDNLFWLAGEEFSWANTHGTIWDGIRYGKYDPQENKIDYTHRRLESPILTYILRKVLNPKKMIGDMIKFWHHIDSYNSGWKKFGINFGAIDFGAKIVSFWFSPAPSDIQMVIELLKSPKVNETSSLNKYEVHVAASWTKSPLMSHIGNIKQDKKRLELMRRQHLDAQAKKALNKDLISIGKKKDLPVTGYTRFGDAVERLINKSKVV